MQEIDHPDDLNENLIILINKILLIKKNMKY